MDRILPFAFLLLALSGCANLSAPTTPSQSIKGNQRWLPAPLFLDDLGQSASFLYYLPAPNSSIAKIRLSDGKSYKHKTYGSIDGRGLAIDNQKRLYESTYADANSMVFELDKNLKLLRAIQIDGGDAEAVAVDQQGVTYVGWHSNDGHSVSIEEFSRDASGPATPIRTISGSQTGLKYPGALAVDVLGNLYVVDGALGEVLTFAPNANGNVAPIALIGGDQTGLTTPVNLTLGADGNMYVSNQLPGSKGGYDVLVFPVSGNGNITPVRTLQSGVYGFSVALGSGGVMYAGLGLESAGTLDSAFAEFAPGASGNDQPVGYLNGIKGSTPFRAVLNDPWYQP